MRIFRLRRPLGLDATFAAYLEGFRHGDADAFTGLPADLSRHPASPGPCVLDRLQGYADGYSQETARQEGAQS